MHPFINHLRTHHSHLATAFTFYTQQSSSSPKKTTIDAIIFDTSKIMDTGASLSALNDITLFISDITVPLQPINLGGIAGGLPIHGYGTVRLYLIDDNNERLLIDIHHCLYVPDLPVSLISPQHLCQSQHNHHHPMEYTITAHNSILKFGQQTMTIPLNPQTNLPTLPIITKSIVEKQQPIAFYINTACVGSIQKETIAKQKETLVNRKDQSQSQRDQTQTETTLAHKDNLSQSQRDLLLWHQCLGHINFAAVQDRSRHDPLMPKHIANCKHPVCPACQYGKAKQRSKGKQRSIIHGCPEIGRECSVDQLESADPRLRYSTKGRKPTSFYKCGTLFCDHGSKLIYLVFQLSTNAKETIASKKEYESFCKRYNRTVESYRTDNGVFTSKEFTNDLTDSNQHHTVCGVGAHWQNSIAEHALDTFRTLDEQCYYTESACGRTRSQYSFGLLHYDMLS
jgi:GAG-pre-integrase domain